MIQNIGLLPDPQLQKEEHMKLAFGMPRHAHGEEKVGPGRPGCWDLSLRPTPEDEAMAKELRRSIRSGFRFMTRPQREVMLCWLSDHPWTQIGQHLGVSVWEARKLWDDGLKMIWMQFVLCHPETNLSEPVKEVLRGMDFPTIPELNPRKEV